MSLLESSVSWIVDHRRITIAIVLAVVLTAGAGVSQLEQDTSFGGFEIGVEEEAKLDYVESNFSTGPDNETVAQVIVRDENVLDKETLLATLELQRAVRENATVAPTLREDRPTMGIANVIARTAVAREEPNASSPTLDRQIGVLESLSQREIDAITARVLGEGESRQSGAFALMPTDYEPGSMNASATMIAVFQVPERAAPTANAPAAIVDSQLAIRDVAGDSLARGDAMVVGNGILTAETEQSRRDTFRIVGPLALLFVLGTLAAVYRDLLDIGLSVLGIALVQVWTFGLLGWVGIAFNPVLIAVPVLLIGLSIDYGLHVFMRYRERRTAAGEGPSAAMRTALAAIGTALVLVTVTTVVGFLSNLASPVGPIRKLGLISAVGIVGALVVFGALLPALKTELDGLLERFGFDRAQRPIGTGNGRAARFLSVGSRAARKAPVAVVIFALLVTAASAVAATDVSTSFEPEDNLAGEPPEWTEHLPAALEPGTYTAKANMRYANEHFVRHDARAAVLVEGDVTRPDALERIASAESAAAETDVAVILANGEPQTENPIAVIERVAARNPSFRETIEAADTDGNGVPDRNLASVYDELFATAPDEAASVIHRTDGGEYEALRVTVAVDSGAEGEAVVDEMRGVADVIEGDGLSATATGDPILRQLIQDHLLSTLLISLAITVLVVLAILAAVYRAVHGSATLGVVTILPVILAVSWIVGTMYAIGYPLSVLTTIVASITIGIGIDYSIHVSDRFREELDRTGSVDVAIARTLRGTGSALLGSAATTASGFGVWRSRCCRRSSSSGRSRRS